jgi:eukaryotic-like serine/threonine-protein kinase
MGEVFRAHDLVLAREVAVKVLHPNLAADPGFVDRFRLEARAAAGLNHPNIVAVHDWGAVDGVYFMVMEFVRGQSLRDVLSEEGLLAPAQAADVLLQVLSALDNAHRSGIVHRDVKPENVMLTRDGMAKVADFGLARAYADARSTQTGTVTGTAQYLAPEQLVGEPADPRTDLYSLGILAFELLTGRTPFDGETGMAIAYKHLRERVPRPSSRNPVVPPGLDGWVASMTEKERELRPESATEARRDLAVEAATLPSARPIGQLVREGPGPGLTAGPERAPTVTIPRTKRPRRRRTGRWLFGVILAVLGLAGAGWGAWTYVVPHHAEVPPVTGLPLRMAEAQLNDAGLSVKLGPGRYDLHVGLNHVLEVRPSPGTVLRRGEVVTLIPSLGPPPVPVPSLQGKTLAEARDLLAKANLTLGTQTQQFSERIAVGRIVGQSVAGNQTAPQGSAIDVVMSKGRRPQPVPRVVGKTEERARSLLSAWTVKTRGRYSATVPRGEVVNQIPSPKTMLQPGKTVVLVVSLGPQFFRLPDFRGKSQSDAEAAIRALGLVPQAYQVPGSSGDTVTGQLPLPGTTVRGGSTVTIYVG